MKIDFNDTESLRRWIAVAPERHTAQLRGLWRLWTAFRGQIERAVK